MHIQLLASLLATAVIISSYLELGAGQVQLAPSDGDLASPNVDGPLGSCSNCETPVMSTTEDAPGPASNGLSMTPFGTPGPAPSGLSMIPVGAPGPAPPKRKGHLYSHGLHSSQPFSPNTRLFRLPSCNGILIDYTVWLLRRIMYPDAAAYQFNATAVMYNIGKINLHQWQLEINFQNNEVITMVSGVSLPPAAALPLAGNNLLLQNPPGLQVLPTAYAAAGQLSGYSHTIKLSGTEIGAKISQQALPHGFELIADGFSCKPSNILQPPARNTVRQCCTYNGGAPGPTLAGSDSTSLPSANHHDVAVFWDVIKSDFYNYEVFVHIDNLQQYTNISTSPGWALQWVWQMDEVLLDCQDCQTLTYGDCDNCAACHDKPTFKHAYSCDPAPTVVDNSPLNGSLTAAVYDVAGSKTNFTMTMRRGHRFWGADNLLFPAKFSLNIPGYDCDPPVRNAQVNSFPSSSQSARQMVPAKASYLMECGQTRAALANFSCCVSISGYWNKTMSPCTSCACKCDSTLIYTNSCNIAAPAKPNPAALLLLGKDLAGFQVVGSKTGRCDDNCGTTVHMNIPQPTDSRGWILQVAAANKGQETDKNWDMVLQLPPLYNTSLQNVYSVNSSFDMPPYEDNLLIEGIPYYNSWLLGGGNVMYTLRFNRTPGSATYNTTGGKIMKLSERLFPTEVWYDGRQCKMPEYLPLNGALKNTLVWQECWMALLLVLLVFGFL